MNVSFIVADEQVVTHGAIVILWYCCPQNFINQRIQIALVDDNGSALVVGTSVANRDCGFVLFTFICSIMRIK